MLRIFITLLMLIVSSKAFSGEESISPEYIDTAFRKAATDVGVPLVLLKAICWSESKYDPKAYNHGDGTGSNHAFGICQVLHSTAREFGFKDENCYRDFSSVRPPLADSALPRSYKGCKLFGVQTNIHYAAKYLKSKMNAYDNSWISSIAAYNTGSLRICKTGKVYRAKDKSFLYTCKKGGLLNQKYVDGVLEALKEGEPGFEIPNYNEENQ